MNKNTSVSWDTVFLVEILDVKIYFQWDNTVSGKLFICERCLPWSRAHAFVSFDFIDILRRISWTAAAEVMNTRKVLDDSIGPKSLSVEFNSDASLFAVGLESGFRSASQLGANAVQRIH